MIEPMLPIALNKETIALAYDENGHIVDEIFSWETAQNFAAEYEVVAIADDGIVTKQEIQDMCDYERKIHIDCFGV